MKKIIGILSSMALALVGMIVTIQPAHAVEGRVKIGVSQYAYDWPIIAFRVQDGQIVEQWTVTPTNTTPFLDATGMRVDAFVYDGGNSSSFRRKISGTGANGEWGACHAMQTGDTIDIVPRSDQGYDWTIWYKNYRNSNCTNA